MELKNISYCLHGDEVDLAFGVIFGDEFLFINVTATNSKCASSVRLRILLEDVNDNSPVFEKNDFIIELNENSPPGHVVAHLTATDRDELDLNKLRYFVIDGLKATKKHAVHKLFQSHIRQRHTISRYFYENFLAADRWKFIVTYDEAWVYLTDCDRKRAIYYQKRVEKSRPIWLKECAESYPKGFMVACGISYEGKLKIRKVEINAKINSEYYQNNILEPIFLNDIPSIYGKQSNKVWFHHDNATSHTSSSTQAYLEDLRQRTGINTIPKNITPVKYPDLAPMDFCIFECLKRALGKRHPRTIEGLWKVVKEEWDLLSMTMIRKCLLS
ncbi:hypothetical protein LAZ67_9002572 [Cordylochernes scorpioides]|uniref:Transposase n=1 Tax=Cordylochernes scorpioides TaxID=51811 RepID=A0ABY6KUK2_9ARAC|nr:hypothetical protein LAZ67_9002572 [Cordylochernes scorpioides]